MFGFPDFLDWVSIPVNSQLTVIFDALEAHGLISVIIFSQNHIGGRSLLLYWNGCAIMDSLFFGITKLLNLYIYLDVVYLKIIVDEICDLATFSFI